MRPFDLLKKAVQHPKIADEDNNDISAIAHDLIGELDADLTLEDYDWESDKIIDLADKLEAELKEADGEADEDEDEDENDEDDDEDDEDDEFEGIDEDEEEEVEK